jgi:dienelactone hydrolase
MSAYLFVPKHTKPPFQAVVFFPSARVNFLTSSAELGDMDFVDYVIKSGRAVIYPVYQKLYERRRSAEVTLPGPTLQRAVLVDWRKDVGRSIDYLETRDDIDRNRIGYLGVSQGSAYGVVIAALEDRLKAVVLLDGGMFQQTSALAGLDQVDFAPRLTKPVLMINGRYDATFPYESAQLPLFRRLGTAAGETSATWSSTRRTTSVCGGPTSSGKCSSGTTSISAKCNEPGPDQSTMPSALAASRARLSFGYQ